MEKINLCTNCGEVMTEYTEFDESGVCVCCTPGGCGYCPYEECPYESN